MTNTVSYIARGSIRSGANVTSTTISMPTHQEGDLLLAQIFYWDSNGGTAPTLTYPVGWIVAHTRSTPTQTYTAMSAIVYKIATASEPSLAITASKPMHILGVVSSFRGINPSTPFSEILSGSSTSNTPNLTSVSYNTGNGIGLELALIFNHSNSTSTPPAALTEMYDLQGSPSGGYLEMATAPTVQGSGSTGVRQYTIDGTPYLAWMHFVIMPIPNAPPTLTITNPADNQTLSEGNALPIQGTAGDTDNGNVVTVKFQINNGPIRAIASGVSDGSTPLSFARTLAYSNKRLWDGAVDVVGADLAENTDHVLRVWAEDDQGGKSAEVTRAFRVIWNRPPTISGTNEDLGTIMEPPVRTYTVTEPEGNPFTITEKINGTVIRTFPGVAGREETVTIPHDLWIRLDLDVPHELTVEAADSKGLTSTRTFTFTRKETHIEFMLDFDNPDVAAHFTLDGQPKRVLVTLERYLPPGSSIEFVKVCNNALDEVPTWEDATAAVVAGRGYLFTNQTKTAASWRINIWVRIAKGTATERVRLDGFGGAFD